MIVTDTWFTERETALLASLVGQEFEKYRIDKQVVPSDQKESWGVVGLFVGGRVYALTADLETHCHFGEEDDIAAVSFDESDEEGVGSRLVGVGQEDWVVGGTIEDILVYNDRDVLAEGGEDAFEYRWVGAVVFKTARTEVVFEPDGWIMETFSVYRGPGASLRVRDAVDSIPEGDRDVRRASRDVVSLREWAEGKRTP